MSQITSLNCPACQGNLEGQATCPHCQADVKHVLAIAVQAHQLRQQATEALRLSHYDLACHLSSQAQSLQYTSVGQKLQDTARIMASLRFGG